MSHHRFPFALFVVALLLTHSAYSMARSVPPHDGVAADKKDNPPRPKPKPGPRGGGDED